MLMMLSDEDLAKAAGQGDREAFSSLLSRHYDRIFALSFRLCGSRAEAEDLTQDICVGLPAKLRSWEGRSRFTTWLYRVVVNASHDQRRRNATRSRTAEGWGDYEVARRAVDTEEAERTAWLEEAMRSLKPEYRETLALTLDQDLTQAEAAEVLGVSEGTIAWRISEVKKHLRQLATSEATQ